MQTEEEAAAAEASAATKQEIARLQEELAAVQARLVEAEGAVKVMGERLREEELGAELWQQTVAVARTYGLTSPLVRRYKPWGLLVLLSVPV